MGDAWISRVEAAARSASAPTEAFLLETDDPRVWRSRQELAHVKFNNDGSKRAATSWARCADRHASARSGEKLGQRRALTDWQDNGGKPTLPDGAWQDWAEAQTERVLDLMDISFLREAKKGVDICSFFCLFSSFFSSTDDVFLSQPTNPPSGTCRRTLTAPPLPLFTVLLPFVISSFLSLCPSIHPFLHSASLLT
jgi:hypothetical protein